jgi:hypothetical protein
MFGIGKWLRRLVHRYVNEELRKIEEALSWERNTKKCVVCNSNIALASLDCRVCGSSQLPVDRQTTGIQRIPESIRYLSSVWGRIQVSRYPEERPSVTYRRLLINDRKRL